jgi:hypothetical protein
MDVIWETSFPTFLLVTVVLAGGAGYMAGRSAALTWRPGLVVIAYAAALACAARFIHAALFHGTWVAPIHWIIDFIVILVITILAFRSTRATQMVRQYPWLYERSGPLAWRRKRLAEAAN